MCHRRLLTREHERVAALAISANISVGLRDQTQAAVLCGIQKGNEDSEGQ